MGEALGRFQSRVLAILPCAGIHAGLLFSGCAPSLGGHVVLIGRPHPPSHELMLPEGCLEYSLLVYRRLNIGGSTQKAADSRLMTWDERVYGEGGRFWVATDPCKAGPTGPHRRHRRAQYGGLARTVPWGSRSAAEHRNARRAASRVRPRLPSRTANTASSNVAPRPSARAASSMF